MLHIALKVGIVILCLISEEIQDVSLQNKPFWHKCYFQLKATEK